jgi:hypothetical protein
MMSAGMHGIVMDGLMIDDDDNNQTIIYYTIICYPHLSQSKGEMNFMDPPCHSERAIRYRAYEPCHVRVSLTLSHEWTRDSFCHDDDDNFDLSSRERGQP